MSLQESALDESRIFIEKNGAALDEAEIERVLQSKVNEMEIVRHLGITFWLGEGGTTEARLANVLPFHTGGQERKAINGPVLMALLDCVMATAAIRRMNGARCATVEMSTKFMKPATTSCTVALGNVVSARGTLIFCEGRVVDRRNRSVAIATATYIKLD